MIITLDFNVYSLYIVYRRVYIIQGAGGLIDSLSRQILRLIEDKPNTLFIAWTHFTNIYLKDECEKELGKYHNLFNRDVNAEELTNKIKQWISLDENKK